MFATEASTLPPIPAFTSTLAPTAVPTNTLAPSATPTPTLTAVPTNTLTPSATPTELPPLPQGYEIFDGFNKPGRYDDSIWFDPQPPVGCLNKAVDGYYAFDCTATSGSMYFGMLPKNSTDITPKGVALAFEYLEGSANGSIGIVFFINDVQGNKLPDYSIRLHTSKYEVYSLTSGTWETTRYPDNEKLPLEKVNIIQTEFEGSALKFTFNGVPLTFEKPFPIPAGSTITGWKLEPVVEVIGGKSVLNARMYWVAIRR